jgi:hypothetical protein
MNAANALKGDENNIKFKKATIIAKIKTTDSS